MAPGQRPRRGHGAWLLAAVLLPVASAKVIESSISAVTSIPGRELIHLGKFCFQCKGACGRAHGNREAFAREAHSEREEAGLIRIEAHGLNRPYGALNYVRGQMVAVYKSEVPHFPERAWRHVDGNRSLTCAQKLGLAYAVFPMDDTSQMAVRNDGLATGAASSAPRIDAHHFVYLEDRPQFFHFAATNCEEGRVDMAYKLVLKNEGDDHMSYDDMGLLKLELVMLVISVVLGLCTARDAARLSIKTLHHPPLMILNNAAWILVLSHVLAVYYYSQYATFGHTPDSVLMWSQMLFVSADLLVMILCLLIARGWRVTSVAFSQGEQNAILAGSFLYVAAYAVVYCVDLVERDPADDVYPLMTGGALWLIFFRLVLFTLCAVFFLRTYDLDMAPPKRRFYRCFMLCAVVWFCAEPSGTIIALCMSPWTRHRNATAVLFWLTHAALVVLVYVLSPGVAQHYFVMTVYKDELDGLVRDTNGARRPDRGDRGDARAHEEDGDDDGFLGGRREPEIRAHIALRSGIVEREDRDDDARDILAEFDAPGPAAHNGNGHPGPGGIELQATKPGAAGVANGEGAGFGSSGERRLPQWTEGAMAAAGARASPGAGCRQSAQGLDVRQRDPADAGPAAASGGANGGGTGDGQRVSPQPANRNAEVPDGML